MKSSQRVLHGVAAGLLSACLLPAGAVAGIPAPKEDVHFLTEHLAEAAQDARYFTQPLPRTTISDNKLHPFVMLSSSTYSNRLMEAGGGLLTVGAESRFRPNWFYSLSAFYDRFNVDGGAKEDILTAINLPYVPLDLPETAVFSGSSGRFRHEGATAIVTYTPQGNLFKGAFAFGAGLMVEHLRLKDYGLHYRLTGGYDSGSEGELSYDTDAWFLTPFISMQYDYALNERFHLLPVAAIGGPLPAGDINTTLSGPGFTISQDSSGALMTHVGDPWIRIGLGLQDRRLGLDYEFGTLATFSAIERLTHQGVDKGVLFGVTWHFR